MFSIGAPSGQPAAAAESLADRGVRAALWAAKLVVSLALFCGVASGFSRAWLAEGAVCAAAPWIAAILAAGLIAAPVSLALQGLDALDLPLSGLGRRAVWQAGLETSYGLTAVTAAFALFAGLFALGVG